MTDEEFKVKKLGLILLVTGILIFALTNSCEGSPDTSRISGLELDTLAETISLDLKEANITDVLRIFSTGTNLNIVSSHEVQGKVTGRLTNVRVEDALRTVLRSCGYGFVKEGEIYRIVKVDPDLLGVDKNTPQVQIESKIVEVLLDKTTEQGINWERLKLVDDDIRIEGQTNLPMGNTGLFLNIFHADADAIVQCLATQVSTHILSSPRLVVMDNKEAKILVGDRIAYQQSFGQTASGITTTSVLFEDVGIKLFVTPHVTDSNFVILKIHVEVSAVKEWRILSNGDEVPIIGTKETETVVIVKDKSTLVIGGLISEEERVSVFKIPLLGDIPLLRFLFRYKSSQKVKKELVVFISPKLIPIE